MAQRPTVTQMSRKFESHAFTLDVAAGTSILGLELNKLGYTYIDALDMSQEMINRAKNKKVYTKLICAAVNDQRMNGIGIGIDIQLCRMCWGS